MYFLVEFISFRLDIAALMRSLGLFICSTVSVLVIIVPKFVMAVEGVMEASHTGTRSKGGIGSNGSKGDPGGAVTRREPGSKLSKREPAGNISSRESDSNISRREPDRELDVVPLIVPLDTLVPKPRHSLGAVSPLDVIPETDVEEVGCDAVREPILTGGDENSRKLAGTNRRSSWNQDDAKRE